MVKPLFLKNHAERYRFTDDFIGGIFAGAHDLKTYAYVYDKEDVALEYSTDGAQTETTRYVHGPGPMIDEPLSIEKDGSVYYYHADGLGSVTVLTNASQQIAERYVYDSFGNFTTVMEEVKNTFRFTGREWDEETGLYYYRARYFDPEIGRFISRDPIGFAGGDWNVYAYVGNGPVNWVDPWGLFSIINDTGGRNGATYGGSITVIGNNGQTVTVSGSSWPNPTNSSPGVSTGSYNSTYSGTGHRGRYPGVRINNGGQVPTMGPNPAQDNQSFATGINIHCGFSLTNRGSAGCVTIQPSQCQEVWDVLQEGEKGTVTINR